MNGRERVLKTLSFYKPDRAPRNLWTLPGVELFRGDELKKIRQRFPGDFCDPDFQYGPALQAKGTPGRKGSYVDAWGCVWTVQEEGVTGEVKQPLIADWADPPYSLASSGLST